MQILFQWDVFLSLSSVDKPRVVRLAERLKQSGVRVWFDRPNIDTGEDIVTAIEQALERSRVLVLCMTTAAIESEWVRLETEHGHVSRFRQSRPTLLAAEFGRLPTPTFGFIG